MLIVIDGPARVGKGTLARGLASHFGYLHIDSGIYYRAVASRVLESGDDPGDLAASLSEEDLKREDLYSKEVGEKVPDISPIAEVRKAINEMMLRLIAQSPGAVMDGRAGASEFPQAEVKIYLTADPDLRAQRAYEHLVRIGEVADLDDLRRRNEVRDSKDMARPDHPLCQSPEAILIDSTKLSIEETLHKAVLLCEERMRYFAN